MAREYDIHVTVSEEPEPDAPLSTSVEEPSPLVRRILRGEFDDVLEDILEAAHHRKRELRDRRRGRG